MGMHSHILMYNRIAPKRKQVRDMILFSMDKQYRLPAGQDQQVYSSLYYAQLVRHMHTELKRVQSVLTVWTQNIFVVVGTQKNQLRNSI